MVEDAIEESLEYRIFRKAAKEFKNKNMLNSGCAYDLDNYKTAAYFYEKAFEVAPNNGEKLSSLEGLASCYWNMEDKAKWCEVKEKQLELLNKQDQPRLKEWIEKERNLIQ